MGIESLHNFKANFASILGLSGAGKDAWKQMVAVKGIDHISQSTPGKLGASAGKTPDLAALVRIRVQYMNE